MQPEQEPRRSAPFRKIFLVDRGIQLKFSLMLMGVGAVMGAVLCALMLLAQHRTRSELQLPPGLATELASRDNVVLWFVVGMALVMLIAAGFLGLLVTHRVAGPVYAMTRYMAALAQGTYPSVRNLRKSDELQDLFALFQKSVDYLRA